MAVVPDKKAPDSVSKSERLRDFSGGLNTKIHGSLLSKREAQIATNVSFEQKGTLIPRRGRKKRFLKPFSELRVSSMGAYYKHNGSKFLLFTSGDTLYYDLPHKVFNYNESSEFSEGTLSERVGGLTPNVIKIGVDTLELASEKVNTLYPSGAEAYSSEVSSALYSYGNIITMNSDLDSYDLVIYSLPSPTEHEVAVAINVNTGGSSYTNYFSGGATVEPNTTRTVVHISGKPLVKDKKYMIAIRASIGWYGDTTGYKSTYIPVETFDPEAMDSKVATFNYRVVGEKDTIRPSSMSEHNTYVRDGYTGIDLSYDFKNLNYDKTLDSISVLPDGVSRADGEATLIDSGSDMEIQELNDDATFTKYAVPLADKVVYLETNILTWEDVVEFGTGETTLTWEDLS